MRSLASLTLALLTIAGGGGCAEEAGLDARGTLAPRRLAAANVDEAEPTLIAVTPAETTLTVGDTLRLTALASFGTEDPAPGTYSVFWKVEAGPLSLADTGGLVRADSVGEGEVGVTFRGLLAYARIQVVARTDSAPTDSLPEEEPGEGEMPDDTTATGKPTETPGSGSAEVAPPAPPKRLDYESVRFFDPANGRTIRVGSGERLQAALDEARPGDQILLAPGASYRGRFRLPRKGDRGGRWITVRTDLGADSLPGGVRMTPALAQARRLASIVGTGALAEPTIETAAGAGGWRFVEVEISADPSGARFGTLVRFGHPDLRTADEIPADMVIDRSWVHGTESLDLLRCIQFNGAGNAVMNSTVDECHAKGFDSYAIGGTSGPGPYRITNNYIAGGGMGIFWGGADPRVADLSPSDFEIRRNHITRPTSWKGRWTVKNLLEFKHARRALIEENVFENHWVDGQSGFAIVLKSVSQYGRAPWSQTSDVTFRRNVLRHVAAGISVAARPEPRPAVPAARIAVLENVVYDVGEFAGTRNGRMLALFGPLADVAVVDNTFLHGERATHALMLDGGRPSRNLDVRGNVFTRGTYGVWASGGGEGASALSKAWPESWRFADNVLVAASSPRSAYPGGTRVVRPSGLSAQLAGVTGWDALRGLLGAAGVPSGVGAPLDAVRDGVAGVAPDFPVRAAAARSRR
jgi:hypothetical protein